MNSGKKKYQSEYRMDQFDWGMIILYGLVGGILFATIAFSGHKSSYNSLILGLGISFPILLYFFYFEELRTELY